MNKKRDPSRSFYFLAVHQKVLFFSTLLHLLISRTGECGKTLSLSSSRSSSDFSKNEIKWAWSRLRDFFFLNEGAL